MSGNRVIRFALVALLMSGLVLTSGCAGGSGGDVDSLTARQSLYDVLDETQDLLGGQWKNQDDPTPRGCSIPLFIDGEMYPALRVGTAHRDGKPALSMVAALWEARGYVVTRSGVRDVSEIQGRNDADQLLVLRVNGAAMTLQGESECRPVS